MNSPLNQMEEGCNRGGMLSEGMQLRPHGVNNGKSIKFANFEEFAGNISFNNSKASEYDLCGSWILDSGASVHVCEDIKLFDILLAFFVLDIKQFNHYELLKSQSQ
ncbi:hypothetical protein LIER_38214 [Lithospermum erythrorhizon]|uniref:Uncharacterized protein n=1 Tax=Lithospermum erythrorhizon TaxID=34254 RepID=A0AAV3PXT3_LITER